MCLGFTVATAQVPVCSSVCQLTSAAALSGLSGAERAAVRCVRPSTRSSAREKWLAVGEFVAPKGLIAGPVAAGCRTAFVLVLVYAVAG